MADGRKTIFISIWSDANAGDTPVSDTAGLRRMPLYEERSDRGRDTVVIDTAEGYGVFHISYSPVNGGVCTCDGMNFITIIPAEV